MSKNKLKTRWDTEKVVLNGWLTIPNSWTSELLAHVGFGALTIDMQHGLIGYETAVSMLQAITTTETIPLVRVPWNEPVHIMKLLDAGSYGVICPMINSRKEAESFVGACRYPPGGYRSYGPIRANVKACDDYFKYANDSIMTFAMIETSKALDNLESILKTEGLSGLYIGTIDLSISLGLSEPGNLEDPKLKSAIDRILSVATQKDKIAGIHASSPEEAAMLASWGFKLITPLNDSNVLLSASRNIYDLTKKKLMKLMMTDK